MFDKMGFNWTYYSYAACSMHYVSWLQVVLFLIDKVDFQLNLWLLVFVRKLPLSEQSFRREMEKYFSRIASLFPASVLTLEEYFHFRSFQELLLVHVKHKGRICINVRCLNTVVCKIKPTGCEKKIRSAVNVRVLYDHPFYSRLLLLIIVQLLCTSTV